MSSSLMVVGHFSRVVKGDGTLLFKPALRDAGFLEEARHLYHHLFGTEFSIAAIKRVAKGFHVRIVEVERPYEAEYLVGEEFSLPRNEVAGRTDDVLIGAPVVDTAGKRIGTVTHLIRTPAYPLLTVQEGKRTFEIPLTDGVAVWRNEQVLLLRDEIIG